MEDIDDFTPLGVGALHKDGDVSVVKVNGEGGYLGTLFMPDNLVRRLNKQQFELMADIQRCVGEIQLRQGALSDMMELGRELGLSWAQLAWSCGLSAEGARRKFGDPV